MFQRETLWISFNTGAGYKAAVKVSVGGAIHMRTTYHTPEWLNKWCSSGVNAISGAAKDGPTPPSIDQDYVVAGTQPWLDGVTTDLGVVRQVRSKLYLPVHRCTNRAAIVKFVAMPLGKGYTVEEQVTGKADHGGLQFDIFPTRDTPPGSFTSIASRYAQSFPFHMTPAELAVPDGAQIHFIP